MSYLVPFKKRVFMMITTTVVLMLWNSSIFAQNVSRAHDNPSVGTCPITPRDLREIYLWDQVKTGNAQITGDILRSSRENIDEEVSLILANRVSHEVLIQARQAYATFLRNNASLIVKNSVELYIEKTGIAFNDDAKKALHKVFEELVDDDINDLKKPWTGRKQPNPTKVRRNPKWFPGKYRAATLHHVMRNALGYPASGVASSWPNKQRLFTTKELLKIIGNGPLTDEKRVVVMGLNYTQLESLSRSRRAAPHIRAFARELVKDSAAGASAYRTAVLRTIRDAYSLPKGASLKTRIRHIKGKFLTTTGHRAMSQSGALLIGAGGALLFWGSLAHLIYELGNMGLEYLDDKAAEKQEIEISEELASALTPDSKRKNQKERWFGRVNCGARELENTFMTHTNDGRRPISDFANITFEDNDIRADWSYPLIGRLAACNEPEFHYFLDVRTKEFIFAPASDEEKGEILQNRLLCEYYTKLKDKIVPAEANATLIEKQDLPEPTVYLQNDQEFTCRFDLKVERRTYVHFALQFKDDVLESVDATVPFSTARPLDRSKDAQIGRESTSMGARFHRDVDFNFTGYLKSSGFKSDITQDIIFTPAETLEPPKWAKRFRNKYMQGIVYNFRNAFLLEEKCLEMARELGEQL